MLNPRWEKIVCSDDRALQSIADGTINSTMAAGFTLSGSSNEGGCECECVWGGSQWRNMGFSDVCFFLDPLWTSSVPLSGPVDVTEVTVDDCLPSYLSKLHVGHHNGEAKEATYFYTNFPL